MTTCKDCLHYGICVFHLKGDENQKCQHYIADVVPKSEVAILEATIRGYDIALKFDAEHYRVDISKLEQDVARLVQEKDALIKNYTECMREYARTIFEEFDKLTQIRETYPHYMTFNLKGYAELKKKYVPDKAIANKFKCCDVCGEMISKDRQICTMCETGRKFLNKTTPKQNF